MSDPVIGHRDFVDGSRRPVYATPDNRQYVLDDDGNQVFGTWVIPEDGPDLPIIVERTCTTASA